ncbi:MAG: sugar phosphate isomerase/epimerase [Syntrophorhabdaceae bacterium]|nr:sugar phosphate isomerase/epimerase [Syntrophorhabdaceae bacterium]MDD4196137.1 sugar phosphate isomerase/epimerase [Syntrophorhabdaceae bacterium]
MNFAFSSNAFRRYNLIDAMQAIAHTGYRGVEIMADIPHAYPPDMTYSEIRRIRNVLRKCHLEVSNINAFELWAQGDTYHPSWIEKDPALRKMRLDHTLRVIDLAQELECPNISVEPGGPVDSEVVDDPHAVFIEGLWKISDRARKAGVRVLIEPEPGLLIENSCQFLDLLQHLDPDVYGLNFDIGHFFCVGENPAHLTGTLHHMTHHYHLEDIAASRVHEHLLPGYGAINIREVLNAIDRTGYSGFVTVELYTYEDRPVEAARLAFKYLESIGCG